MSEIGEMYAELKKIRQEKKCQNITNATKILDKGKIDYEAKNHGIHLILNTEQGKIDFWPSTGLWKTRSGKAGRGIRNLINYIV